MSGRKPSSQLRENIRSFLVLKGIEEEKIVEEELLTIIVPTIPLEA